MSMIDNGPAVRSKDHAAEDVDGAAIELLRGFVQEMIKRCRSSDKPWCLYTRDGSRVLGRRPSRSRAERQERAVKAHGG